MNTRILTLAAVAALVLAGCATASPEPSASGPAADIVERYGLDGLTTTEIVDMLDRTPLEERSAELFASVRPTELRLSDPGTEEPVLLPIEGDNFYLSVAPYVDSTHECYFHSLTTCKGELRGEEVHIVVTDVATGETLVDEVTTTFDNGFVAVWLPRDIEATLRIEHEELVAEAPIATGPEDPTCITTMQLA